MVKYTPSALLCHFYPRCDSVCVCVCECVCECVLLTCSVRALSSLLSVASAWLRAAILSRASRASASSLFRSVSEEQRERPCSRAYREREREREREGERERERERGSEGEKDRHPETGRVTL